MALVDFLVGRDFTSESNLQALYITISYNICNAFLDSIIATTALPESYTNSLCHNTDVFTKSYICHLHTLVIGRKKLLSRPRWHYTGMKWHIQFLLFFLGFRKSGKIKVQHHTYLLQDLSACIISGMSILE